MLTDREKGCARIANFGNSPRTMATSSQQCSRGHTEQSL